MKVRVFITYKKAEHFQDCQDRFSVNCDTKSVAVSDGVSQSIFQKIWAEILVDAYTESRAWNPSNEPDHSTVKTRLSSIWTNRVKERLNEMQKEGRNTIRTENSIALGGSAGATIVGVRFNGNKWYGDVLGDSCLIEVKDSKIVRFLSSQDGDGFDNHPDYYDSNPNKKGKGIPKAIDGELSSGMYLLLVSDPFSDFFMEQKKNDNESQFVEEILSVKSHEDFEILVSKWRAAYGMHNDDSTLIIIESDGHDEWSIYSDNINDLIKGDAVATMKAPSNPFHNNNSQAVETSKIEQDVLDNTTSSINNERKEVGLQKSSSSPIEIEVVSKPSSTKQEPSVELQESSKDFKVQELENEISQLKNERDKACEDAKKWEEKYNILFKDNENIKKELDSFRIEKETFETRNKNIIDEHKGEKKQLEKKINDLDELVVKHQKEIASKDKEILGLKDQLHLAQSPRIVERSTVCKICLSEYEKYLSTHLIKRYIPGFNQHDVMNDIVNRLLDGPYIIIER